MGEYTNENNPLDDKLLMIEDNIVDVEHIELEENIPEFICDEIVKQASNNLHFEEVYRVAKWGKIEEKAFLSTYGEIEEGYIPDNDERYPKEKIGTYSTSVYTEKSCCDKYINLLKRSVRLRTIYPFPVVLKGKTSNGLVQKTVERIVNYTEPAHVDWWIFKGKKGTILNDFILCD